MHPFIFLGGTAGNSKWREPFVARLIEAGVPVGRIYNPVVADWAPECQRAEDVAKREADYQMFYLCDPEEPGNPVSVYSLIEAAMGLYDRPRSTLVVFDLAGFADSHALQALRKIEQDLRARFPHGHIFSSAPDALSFLAEANRTTSSRMLAGSSGGD